MRGTLFVDGQRWLGSSVMLRNRRGAEVQEVRRVVGGTGVYEGYQVVIEIIFRRGAGG